MGPSDGSVPEGNCPACARVLATRHTIYMKIAKATFGLAASQEGYSDLFLLRVITP